MAKTVFVPVKGARISKKAAQVFGAAISKLAPPGHVTAEQVLEAAQNKKNPLHKYFDWNDKSAATRWRLQQALYLLRSIDIVVVDAKGKQLSVRAFHNVVTEDGERVFGTVDFVFNNASLSSQVIAQAKAEMEGWILRYGKYDALAKAVAKAKVVLKTIK